MPHHLPAVATLVVPPQRPRPFNGRCHGCCGLKRDQSLIMYLPLAHSGDYTIKRRAAIANNDVDCNKKNYKVCLAACLWLSVALMLLSWGLLHGLLAFVDMEFWISLSEDTKCARVVYNAATKCQMPCDSLTLLSPSDLKALK